MSVTFTLKKGNIEKAPIIFDKRVQPPSTSDEASWFFRTKFISSWTERLRSIWNGPVKTRSFQPLCGTKRTTHISRWDPPSLLWPMQSYTPGHSCVYHYAFTYKQARKWTHGLYAFSIFSVASSFTSYQRLTQSQVHLPYVATNSMIAAISIARHKYSAISHTKSHLRMIPTLFTIYNLCIISLWKCVLIESCGAQFWGPF